MPTFSSARAEACSNAREGEEAYNSNATAPGAMFSRAGDRAEVRGAADRAADPGVEDRAEDSADSGSNRP